MHQFINATYQHKILNLHIGKSRNDNKNIIHCCRVRNADGKKKKKTTTLQTEQRAQTCNK